MSAQLFTTGEVARRCSVKPDTVLKWIKRGRLRAARTLGGHYRVEERDILPLLSKPASVETASAPKVSLLSQPLRCWEYMSEDLREAAMQALTMDRAACREYASGFGWQASARQFIDNIKTARAQLSAP